MFALLHQPLRPVVIRRGKLTPNANDGELAPPGSGATITLFDSTANHNGVGNQIQGLPFSRVVVSINSSADSAAGGIVFQSNFDDSHFRTQSTQSYATASGPATYDFLLKGDHLKVTYQNSANVLTTWEMVIMGYYDRNPGS